MHASLFSTRRRSNLGLRPTLPSWNRIPAGEPGGAPYPKTVVPPSPLPDLLRPSGAPTPPPQPPPPGALAPAKPGAPPADGAPKISG